MPKAFSDDLRVRILDAYERGEGSMRVLSLRFGTGFEYVRKVVRSWRCTGQKERMPQSRHGRAGRIDAAVEEQLREWLREQPDRTLAELGELLRASGVQTSRSRISVALQRMGLRLKKSPSTRPSVTPRPTASVAQSTLPPSPRFRVRS